MLRAMIVMAEAPLASREIEVESEPNLQCFYCAIAVIAIAL